MKKLKSFKKNKDSRDAFIHFWAKYVKEHSDQEWGSQQAILINSILQSAKQKHAQKAYLKKINSKSQSH